MTDISTTLLKEKRNEIVNLLKEHGTMTVESLAARLNLTKVSIRRHLELLEKDELVAYRTEWRERGRPHHVYSLTEKAEDLFPKTYDAMARDLLHATQRCFGERGVLKVLATRGEEMMTALRPHLEGLDFDAKVEKLASLLIERGYLAEYRLLPDGSYLLVERNCPTIKVAVEFPQVCQQEKRLYAQVLECEVIREQRIAAGDSVCLYRVLRPTVASESQARKIG